MVQPPRDQQDVVRFQQDEAIPADGAAAHGRYHADARGDQREVVFGDDVRRALARVARSRDERRGARVRRKTPRGLRRLELVVEADAKGFPRFAYATDLDQFEPTLLDVFATGIQTLHGVKSLEPAIMSEMNWTWWPTLVATGVNDEVVQMAREAMMRHLRAAVGKLKEYLKLYDEYLPLLRLDVAKYVEETRRRDPEEEEGRLAAYLAEIAEHETQLARRGDGAQTNRRRMLPRGRIRGSKALWEKRAELAEKVRQLVAEFPRKITDAVNKEYQELHAKLQVPSEDPEGLQEAS